MSGRLRFGDQAAGAATFTLDGKPYQVQPGETIAAALYAAGVRAWRRSRAGDLRGLLCGMGICFDCLVTVDGVANQRACQVLVRDGMVVVTNRDQEGTA